MRKFQNYLGIFPTDENSANTVLYKFENIHIYMMRMKKKPF